MLSVTKPLSPTTSVRLCSCLVVCVCAIYSLHIYSPVEGVLTSVYLRSRTLVIESRDCIGDRENYRIIIATPTTLVNVSFNATVEYDLGDIVSSGTEITVQLVETTSNTIIDEMTYTIMYPTPTKNPIATPTETGLFTLVYCSSIVQWCSYIGVIRDVKQKSNSAVKEIAAGVVGVVVGVLAIVAASVCLIVWLCVRKRRSKYDGRCVQFLIHCKP